MVGMQAMTHCNGLRGANLLLLVALLAFLHGAEGRPELTGENERNAFSVSVVAGVAGLVGLAMVVMVCAGETRVNPNVRRAGPPDWTRSLFFSPSMNVGFGDTSEGIHTPTPFLVVRERLGVSVTDAARWTCPITEGKHVFEVYWQKKKNRGHSCCIGLASPDVRLSKQGRVSLVGEHSQSWGLDLAKQRSLHSNKMQQRLSRGIPDRFFVYVDMDSGKIGFGDNVGIYKEEAEFYGFICHGIPKGKEMYLVISMCAPNEQVHVHYRGTAVPHGGYNLLDTQSPLEASKPTDRHAHQVYEAKQPAPPTYTSSVSDDNDVPAPSAYTISNPEKGHGLQF